MQPRFKICLCRNGVHAWPQGALDLCSCQIHVSWWRTCETHWVTHSPTSSELRQWSLMSRSCGYGCNIARICSVTYCGTCGLTTEPYSLPDTSPSTQTHSSYHLLLTSTQTFISPSTPSQPHVQCTELVSSWSQDGNQEFTTCEWTHF